MGMVLNISLHLGVFYIVSRAVRLGSNRKSNSLNQNNYISRPRIALNTRFMLLLSAGLQVYQAVSLDAPLLSYYVFVEATLILHKFILA